MATRLGDDMFKLKVYIEPNHDFDYKLPNQLVRTDYGTYEEALKATYDGIYEQLLSEQRVTEIK